MQTKKMLVIPVLVLMAGCATKEMKSTPFYEGSDVTYTGSPEDRVNLWPVAYWREPVGSVLWPLTSFSDDHFALRPIYSQYKQDGKDGQFDEFNFLWPICQADTKYDDYRVFPLLWGTDSEKRGYQALFPIYWNGAHYNSLFPLWIYRNTGKERHFSALFGMAGHSAKASVYEANWCFPLWYWNNRGTFVTTFFGKWDYGWAIPPLLSWGVGEFKTNCNYSAHFLLGLGGVKKDNDDIEHWAFPLYNREEMLCGDSNRLCKTQLLLNSVGWEDKGGDMRSLYVFPLGFWNKDEISLVPLFYWDDDGSLLTLLGGRTVGSTTNVFVTPLVKHMSGKETGGWIFPLWSRRADSDFRETADKLDRDRLPEDIRIWMEASTNMVWNSTNLVWQEEKKDGEPVVTMSRHASWMNGRDETDWLLLCSWNDKVWGGLGSGYVGPTNTCETTEREMAVYGMTRKIERGNDLLFKYERKREVAFSAIDRTKESDEETTDVSLLVWLYNYSRETSRMDADTYTQHRVLWRLWDWERKNGDVSLDVFPGFTYDSKTDGYVKTSFFWRLFRYEKDPKKGTNLDLLFIPLCRP